MSASLHDACVQLRAMCVDGVERVTIMVRSDGRVEIQAEDARHFVRWTMRADVEPGPVLPSPDEAAARLGSENRHHPEKIAGQ